MRSATKTVRHLIIYCGLLCGLFACGEPAAPDLTEGDYLKAPFTALDTLATNDWWNRGDNPIIEMKVDRDSVIGFGVYTVADGVLKLSAQLYPLYPGETKEVRLELEKDGKWTEVDRQNVNELGWSARFRVEDWDDGQTVPYRLRHGEKASYEGSIRAVPATGAEFVLAAFSCNSNKDRGDREEYARNVAHLNPDLLFFAGDQSYDHKEHTAAWLKFGKQFHEAFRHRPMIAIPDDHDIGQGNLWGQSGRIAEAQAGHHGGYFFHHEYVKMVERCQTAHLPDPYDATPIDQGIGVYYTDYKIGPVDFAIIEDRKFKSGPFGKIPQMGPRPDHVNDPAYDPTTIDLPGLKLLGDRQLAFLEAWSQDDSGRMKAVLSATGFCGGAHLHGSKDGRLHADLDSNGWPQTGRNKAVRLIKAARAVHIAGDQHLATVIHHGTEEFKDGPWAFVVPAIVNNYYSRWWWPADEKAGANPVLGSPLPWTGDYLDGFHNKISMQAYVNPDAASSGAGFGVIRFHPAEGEVTFECWARDTDLRQPDAEQFPGWPVRVKP